MQIRNKILKEIPNAKQAFVRKEVSIKHHKVGVAESTKEEVNNALKNAASFCKNSDQKIDLSDLIELGLVGNDNSSILRSKLCNKLNIGFSNSKHLLLKLNSINIDRKELIGIINEIK